MTRARLAVGLEYDGSGLHGWQSQSASPNVQDAVNEALSRVADEEVRCMGAGRTDAGVHAIEQVAHFETGARRSSRDWLFGANTYLPDDINLLWVREVPGDFHARHSALSRTYAYLILNRSVRSALERNRAWLIRDRLDDEAMNRAAQALTGEHDFSSFRAADCQARSPVRRIMDIRVRRSGQRVWILCRANGFLQRMVRNIAGSLALVGRGREAGAWIAGILAARSREAAGPAAPPQGLYLQQIEYPPDLLPERNPAGLGTLLPIPKDI
ncbi:MAG: tRNA pseudouridine(38-40) synthase TruA [Gammaproteobacteria bacterium]|nr:tRNA pseudouridine(38-40) synthase TruA [Gammaproteobacteria bacterium]MDE0414348.1 tRNA pseudouridine(38-40) synthase TruA [Gammaproteobacteria bacterium]